MSVKKEVRFLKDYELRSTGNKLSGYAAVYNSPSADVGKFTEVIHQGALDRAIREKQNVVLLYNHNPSALLARTSAQTLHLSSDNHGPFLRLNFRRPV
jgi:HK97 family phage prohead protease